MGTREGDLHTALNEAKAYIAELEEWVDKVKAAALILATVVAVLPKKLCVSHKGETTLVNIPKNSKLKPGDMVWLAPQSGQIIDEQSIPRTSVIATFIRRIGKDLAEVTAGDTGHKVIVYAGKLGDAKQGDEVLLDSNGAIILESLPSPAIKNKVQIEATNVSYADIAGLDEAKHQLNDAIVMPNKHPKLYARYGRRPPKGILMYGPPGCGKTMLGKAAATSLAEVCSGKGSEPGFIYIKGPEILSQFVSVAEHRIAAMFTEAREYYARAGHKAIIFIDEADAIFGQRGRGISSDIEKTIVPAFLAEMDGLNESGAMVLLATNRPDTLDSAVVREGRVDRKIRIPRPTPTVAADVFKLNLTKVPIGDHSLDEVSVHATAEMFDEKRVLYKIRTKSGSVLPFRLYDIINGAMIANAVDQAAERALYRDLDSGKESHVTTDDLYKAIDAIQHQNEDMNHHFDIHEFVTKHGEEFGAIVSN